MNNPLGNKLYYSISEVAEITDLQPYTLRAWEREFPCLRPRRNRGKNRAYRERDIGIILLIKQLLYNERYTTQGVKKKLKDEPELLRQIGPQMPLLLEKAKNKGADPGETPHIATEVAKDIDKEQFRLVVEDAKKQLREILDLL
ncbi:MAG: MerR family transcriptional regulator [Candidatus Latescibacteria bacterium]|nr:MerR family transcriptional regulator [Candidatus Latescibacterota bacterium]